MFMTLKQQKENSILNQQVKKKSLKFWKWMQYHITSLKTNFIGYKEKRKKKHKNQIRIQYLEIDPQKRINMQRKGGLIQTSTLTNLTRIKNEQILYVTLRFHHICFY